MPDKNSDIEIRSQEVQEILTAIPNWMVRWGNSLLFLLILLFIFISWLIKYPDVIESEATITTLNPPERIYSHSHGKFEVILVNNEDEVLAGEPLAVIKNPASYQDVLFLKKLLDGVDLKSKRFHLLSHRLSPLSLGDITTSYEAFESKCLEYELNHTLNPFEGKVLTNKLSSTEARNKLDILLKEEELYKAELEFQKREWNRQKELHEMGGLATADFEKQEVQFFQAKKSFMTHQSSIFQLKTLIAKSDVSMKVDSLENMRMKIKLRNDLTHSLYQLKKAIKNWEENYVLRSSINGKVSFLSFWREYQRVNSGDLIFTIIPLIHEGFIGELKVSPTNSGKIEIGQPVRVKLANYSHEEFGELVGVVNSISPVQDPNGNYWVNAHFPDGLTTTFNRSIDFKQEMKGSAEIITEDLRLTDRLFYQLKSKIR